MTWFGWFFIVWQATAAAATTFLVGRPREPLTPDTAAVTVLFSAVLIVGILTVGTGSL